MTSNALFRVSMLVCALVAFLGLPLDALAQVADPAADGVADIKTKIELYTGYAVGLVIAFLLGRWALRALGLMSPGR